MEDIITSLNDDQEKSLKKEDEMSLWKKKLIIGAVIAMFVIIILVVILLAVRSSSSSDDSENTSAPIGEIVCQYKIEDPSKRVKLLGNEFEKEGKLEIFISKKQVEFTKEYSFDNVGEFEVTFKLYDKINMNYMFKDVTTLKSIIMVSNKDAQITSMVSTFENCEN